MINSVKGLLAYSLAGHDKDQIYIIIKEENEYVYLVDGEIRTVAKPKVKKKKHIQVIHHKDDSLMEKLVKDMPIRNEEIKRIIKLYKRSKKVSDKVGCQ